jgi:hypothetical protein
LFSVKQKNPSPAIGIMLRIRQFFLFSKSSSALICKVKYLYWSSVRETYTFWLSSTSWKICVHKMLSSSLSLSWTLAAKGRTLIKRMQLGQQSPSRAESIVLCTVFYCVSFSY